MYLEENPFVEGGGGGECEVLGNAVNPLKLTRKPLTSSNMMAEALMDEPALLKRTNRSHTFMQYRQKESSVEKQMNESVSVLNRVRRDRSMIIRADKLIDGDGKKSNTVTMVRKFTKNLQILHF